MIRANRFARIGLRIARATKPFCQPPRENDKRPGNQGCKESAETVTAPLTVERVFLGAFIPLKRGVRTLRSFFFRCCFLKKPFQASWNGGFHQHYRSLVTRIAATSNRKSLATAIATQKNHCDSENTCKTVISLRFLREKLATSKLRLAIASDL